MPTGSNNQLFATLTTLLSSIDIEKFKKEVADEGDDLAGNLGMGTEAGNLLLQSNLDFIYNFLDVFKPVLGKQEEEVGRLVVDGVSLLTLSGPIQKVLDGLADSLYDNPEKLASLIKLLAYLLLKSKASQQDGSQMRALWKSLAEMELTAPSEHHADDIQYQLVASLIKGATASGGPDMLKFLATRMKYYSEGQYLNMVLAGENGEWAIANVFKWVKLVPLAATTMFTMMRTRHALFHSKALETAGVPQFYYDLTSIKSMLGLFEGQDNLIQILLESGQLSAVYDIISAPIIGGGSILDAAAPSLTKMLRYQVVNLIAWLKDGLKLWQQDGIKLGEFSFFESSISLTSVLSRLGITLPGMPVGAASSELHHRRLVELTKTVVKAHEAEKHKGAQDANYGLFNLSAKVNEAMLKGSNATLPAHFKRLDYKNREQIFESYRGPDATKNPRLEGLAEGILNYRGFFEHLLSSTQSLEKKTENLSKMFAAIMSGQLSDPNDPRSYSSLVSLMEGHEYRTSENREMLENLAAGVIDASEIFKDLCLSSDSVYSVADKLKILNGLFVTVLDNHKIFENMVTSYAPISGFDFTKAANQGIASYLFENVILSECTVQKFKECEFRGTSFSNLKIKDNRLEFDGCKFDADSLSSLVLNLRSQGQLDKLHITDMQLEGDMLGISLVGIGSISGKCGRTNLSYCDVQGVDLSNLHYQGDLLKLKNVFLANLNEERRAELQTQLLDEMASSSVTTWMATSTVSFAGILLSELPDELGVSENTIYNLINQNRLLWKEAQQGNINLDTLKNHVKDAMVGHVADNLSREIAIKLLGEDADGRYLAEAARLKGYLSEWLKDATIEEEGLFNLSSQEYKTLRDRLLSILVPRVETHTSIAGFVNQLLSGQNKSIRWHEVDRYDTELAKVACAKPEIFSKLEELESAIGRSRVCLLFRDDFNELIEQISSADSDRFGWLLESGVFNRLLESQVGERAGLLEVLMQDGPFAKLQIALQEDIGVPQITRLAIIDSLSAIDINLLTGTNVQRLASCWQFKDLLLAEGNSEVLRLVATDEDVAKRIASLAHRGDLTRFIDLGWWTGKISASAHESLEKAVNDAKNAAQTPQSDAAGGGNKPTLREALLQYIPGSSCLPATPNHAGTPRSR